jgi:hypothetical protein
MKTRTEAARESAGKYQDCGMAKRVAAKQNYPVVVLLGDDGRFWVPATTADMTNLLRAGYEAAE